MDRKIIVTEDNSKTLLIPSINETYHSTHGAFNEAIHVFIDAGLKELKTNKIRVFEMGFGTGLNALVTLDYAIQNKIDIEFTSIEKYPLQAETVQALEYPSKVNPALSAYFDKMHASEWNKLTEIHPRFSLKKIEGGVETLATENNYYDVVYFDAFGPRVQPELWSVDVLKKMYDHLKQNGILVTYCAQGQFKRNLKAAGFEMENLPGPPGKREMTRGIKPVQ